MNTEKIKKAAKDSYNWLVNAIEDISYSQSEEYLSPGERDVEADNMFSDKDTLKDLIGDRVFDEATQMVGFNHPDHNKIFNAICEEIKKRSHRPLKEALEELIRER